MKNKALAMAAMAEVLAQGNNAIMFPKEKPNPMFIPRQHSVESYRSQQRRAKKKNRRTIK